MLDIKFIRENPEAVKENIIAAGTTANKIFFQFLISSSS